MKRADMQNADGDGIPQTGAGRVSECSPADSIGAAAKKQNFRHVPLATRGLAQCPCLQDTWLNRWPKGVEDPAGRARILPSWRFARCLLVARLYGPAARCKPKVMIWRILVLRFCIRP